MKLFFGDDFDAMLTELRGQNHKAMRMQTLKSAKGNTAFMETHMSAVCNGIVYHAIGKYSCKLPESGGQEALQKIQQTVTEFENMLRSKCGGMDVKQGIFSP